MSEISNEDDRKNRLLKDLINMGGELAGGAVGGALGFLAGGPVGATVLGAGGAVAAKALKYIGNEISERLLSPREKVRVGGVLIIAAAEIGQRIEKGEKIRDDGFFSKKINGRSDADEAVESVLLKSQREPEEKKIIYMGHLLANLAFHQEISIEMAHQISKAAEQLTYRQLCLLKLSTLKDVIKLRKEDYRGQSYFSKDLYQILYEYMDLYHRGYINFDSVVAFGPTDIKPGSTTVQGLGADIFDMMQLNNIPVNDIMPIIEILK